MSQRVRRAPSYASISSGNSIMMMEDSHEVTVARSVFSSDEDDRVRQGGRSGPSGDALQAECHDRRRAGHTTRREAREHVATIRRGDRVKARGGRGERRADDARRDNVGRVGSRNERESDARRAHSRVGVESDARRVEHRVGRDSDTRVAASRNGRMSAASIVRSASVHTRRAASRVLETVLVPIRRGNQTDDSSPGRPASGALVRRHALRGRHSPSPMANVSARATLSDRDAREKLKQYSRPTINHYSTALKFRNIFDLQVKHAMDEASRRK